MPPMPQLPAGMAELMRERDDARAQVAGLQAQLAAIEDGLARMAQVGTELWQADQIARVLLRSAQETLAACARADAGSVSPLLLEALEVCLGQALPCTEVMSVGVWKNAVPAGDTQGQAGSGPNSPAEDRT